jgi:hypothetical protein
VLLALAVGLVIGIAIGDSSLVSSAKSGIVHDLSSELSSAHKQESELRQTVANAEAFTNSLYPIAVHGLLGGQSIGLVFLGGSSDRVDSLVRDAVTEAGGNLATVIAVREPLDLAGVAGEAAGTHYAALAESPSAAEQQLIERFGMLVGRQFVSGGQLVNQELLSRVRNGLLSAFDGQLGKLQGLVVMRSQPTEMTAQQTQALTAFQSGMIDGVNAVGVPTVGVELTSTEPSQVPWYQSQNLSSVDDLDATSGQAALIYALTGSHGSFGVKSTANSLLPNIGGTATQP